MLKQPQTHLLMVFIMITNMSDYMYLSTNGLGCLLGVSSQRIYYFCMFFIKILIQKGQKH